MDLKEIHKINNLDLALIEADTQNIQDLRNMVDNLKRPIPEMCFNFQIKNSKVVMVCGVTDDIQDS